MPIASAWTIGVHERAEFFHAGAVRHVEERIAAGAAHLDLAHGAGELFGERAVDFFDDAGERCVDTEARFDRGGDEVERVRERPPDLLLAPLDAAEHQNARAVEPEEQSRRRTYPNDHLRRCAARPPCTAPRETAATPVSDRHDDDELAGLHLHAALDERLLEPLRHVSKAGAGWRAGRCPGMSGRMTRALKAASGSGQRFRSGRV